MPPELPLDRIVILDRRIFGAHTLPDKNILATAPDHIDLKKLQAKWCEVSFQSSLYNLKRPAEHVPNDSCHKMVNVLNRVMEDEFICIAFKTSMISQTKLIDLIWTWID